MYSNKYIHNQMALKMSTFCDSVFTKIGNIHVFFLNHAWRKTLGIEEPTLSPLCGKASGKGSVGCLRTCPQTVH